MNEQEFNLQPGFINNSGNILFYEDITKNGNKLSTYKVCRLLNQLYEENEKLQKENVELKQENHDIKLTIEELYSYQQKTSYEYGLYAKHIIEELYYTYIYEPSENYDEEALGQITNLLLKEENEDEEDD